MFNVLKYRKYFKTVAVWLRFGCGYFFNLLMFSTVQCMIKLRHQCVNIHFKAFQSVKHSNNVTELYIILKVNVF